jgi:hypothetical protein
VEPVAIVSMLNKKANLAPSVLNVLIAFFQESLPSSDGLGLSEKIKLNENELLELPPEGPPDDYFVWFGCASCGRVGVLTGETFRHSCLIQCPSCGAYMINEASTYGTFNKCGTCMFRIRCLAHSKIKDDEICMTARLL